LGSVFCDDGLFNYSRIIIYHPRRIFETQNFEVVGTWGWTADPDHVTTGSRCWCSREAMVIPTHVDGFSSS